jgi:hypothetical protein
MSVVQEFPTFGVNVQLNVRNINTTALISSYLLIRSAEKSIAILNENSSCNVYGNINLGVPSMCFYCVFAVTTGGIYQ